MTRPDSRSPRAARPRAAATAPPAGRRRRRRAPRLLALLLLVAAVGLLAWARARNPARAMLQDRRVLLEDARAQVAARPGDADDFLRLALLGRGQLDEGDLEELRKLSQSRASVQLLLEQAMWIDVYADPGDDRAADVAAARLSSLAFLAPESSVPHLYHLCRLHASGTDPAERIAETTAEIEAAITKADYRTPLAAQALQVHEWCRQRVGESAVLAMAPARFEERLPGELGQVVRGLTALGWRDPPPPGTVAMLAKLETLLRDLELRTSDGVLYRVAIEGLLELTAGRCRRAALAGDAAQVRELCAAGCELISCQMSVEAGSCRHSRQAFEWGRRYAAHVEEVWDLLETAEWQEGAGNIGLVLRAIRAHSRELAAERGRELGEEPFAQRLVLPLDPLGPPAVDDLSKLALELERAAAADPAGEMEAARAAVWRSWMLGQ